MTKFEQATLTQARDAADLLVVLCDKGQAPTPALTTLAAALSLTLEQLQRAGRGAWAAGEPTRFVVGAPGAPDLAVVTVDGDATEFELVAAAVRLASRIGAYDRPAVLSALSGDEAGRVLSCTLLGLAVGAHPIRGSLATTDGGARNLLVVSDGTVDAAMLERTSTYAEATCWARDLVNAAPSAATPGLIAQHVRAELGALPNVTYRVFGPDDLVGAGFGAVAAVGTSSQNAPCLLELRYDGAPDQDRHVALCGKGITYDGGGMNVKPAEVQRWMKADMAGGAAVLAAFRGAARRGLHVNIRAVVPLAENLNGERALRQGDVITHLNGLTTEITHTDAEGRLVLADGLAHLALAEPEVIVDVATLTNWILGPDLWMVMGNDPVLIEDLLRAGSLEGEPGWQLPMWAPYAESTRSTVADLQNHDFAEVAPDTIVAAHYLQRFVAGRAWAHLDIVGTAYHTARGNDGLAGATGSATRTLLRFLEERSLSATGVA